MATARTNRFPAATATGPRPDRAGPLLATTAPAATAADPAATAPRPAAMVADPTATAPRPAATAANPTATAPRPAAATPDARERPDAAAPEEPDVAALWRDHEAGGGTEALLLHYRGLVAQIAGRMSVDLPPYVERCDLVSYGILGLVDAIDKFDRSRGVKFETYAAVRIRGAVLDGLRDIDWVPRSVRTRSRDVARAETALQMALHRRPTEAEVAAAAGITVASLRKLAADAALGRVLPLDDRRHASALTRAESDAALSPGAGRDQPGHELEAAERRRAVACAVADLPDRDRTVIDLYYYRGLKLTEIGRMLGITEARVSQLHSRARSALRETLLAADL